MTVRLDPPGDRDGGHQQVVPSTSPAQPSGSELNEADTAKWEAPNAIRRATPQKPFRPTRVEGFFVGGGWR